MKQKCCAAPSLQMVFDRHSPCVTERSHQARRRSAMSSLQAASLPFANTDLTRAWVGFKVPSVDIAALLESQRKNAAALTTVNQIAFDGLTELAQRQSELIKTTVDDCGKATSDVLAAASLEERATKQADAARHIYVSTVVR